MIFFAGALTGTAKQPEEATALSTLRSSPGSAGEAAIV